MKSVRAPDQPSALVAGVAQKAPAPTDSAMSLATNAKRTLIRRSTLLFLAASLGALLWCFWPVCAGLWREWQDNPNYSVGLLVPPVALWLAWGQRRTFSHALTGPCWTGIVLLLVAFGLRFLGIIYLYESIERYALLVAVAGALLLIAGWGVLREARWILLFLVLMIPLPGRVHNWISPPLQRAATAGTVELLDWSGIHPDRQGNVLAFADGSSIGIVEACSGLRMLTAFVVVAAFFAFTVSMYPWQKAVLLALSIPIAVACNLIRLYVTAWLHVRWSPGAAAMFHDYGGLSMMPMAVAMLAGVMWTLGRLVEPASGTREKPVKTGSPGKARVG